MAEEELLPLIPTPLDYRLRARIWLPPDAAAILAQPELGSEADFLVGGLRREAGLSPRLVTEDSPSDPVAFRLTLGRVGCGGRQDAGATGCTSASEACYAGSPDVF